MTTRSAMQRLRSLSSRANRQFLAGDLTAAEATATQIFHLATDIGR